MKRQFVLIFTVLALTAVAVCCNKADEFSPSVSVDSLSFSAEDVVQTINLTSCNRWEARSTEPWCSVFPESGSSDKPATTSIRVRCSPNKSTESRQCEVIITGDGFTKSINVRQDIFNGIIIQGTEYELTEEEQTFKVNLWANVDFEIEIEESAKPWISYVGTKSMAEEEVPFLIARNDGGARAATITFTYGKQQESISVKQEPKTIIIADKTLRELLSYADRDNDGKLTYDEAQTVTSLHIDDIYGKITSTSGLEDFKNLETIFLWSPAFDGFDFTQHPNIKELNIAAAHWAEIDLSNCPLLNDLQMSGTEITNLNLCGCPNLVHLRLDWMQELEQIQLPEKNALLKFEISRCPKLTDFNFEKATMLKSFHLGDTGMSKISINLQHLSEISIYDHQNLSSLDIDSCASLCSFSCSNNPVLSNLSIKGNQELKSISFKKSVYGALVFSDCQNITDFTFNGNKTDILDLSCLTNLYKAEIDNNEINTISINGLKKFKTLSAENNSLKSIRISDCDILESAKLNNDCLTSIDFENVPSLSYVYLENNGLQELNLTNLPAIKYISCDKNELVHIDASGLKSLESMHCQVNKISSINFDGCSMLHSLFCSNNCLTMLDLSDTDIRELYCLKNPELEIVYIPYGSRPNVYYDPDITRFIEK